MILSFQQKEHIDRITWLINKEFRSRSFNLTHSPLLQRFHVGRKDSRTRKVLVLVFSRRQCYGSKRWRWSFRWTTENHRAQIRGFSHFPNFSSDSKFLIHAERATNARQLITWNTSGPQENVLVISFLRLTRTKIIIYDTKCCRIGYRETCRKR